MILDRKITLYRGVKDTTGRPATIADYIKAGIAHRADIERLRATDDPEARRAIKQSLPCATISGLFSPTRKTSNLTHSGLICADIDHVDEPGRLMREIIKFDNVAYVARSCGGHGVFAIIPLATPEQHDEQFRALCRAFKTKLGVELDRACKDVTRLRFVSYDPDAMIRHDAVPYVGIEYAKTRRRTPAPAPDYSAAHAVTHPHADTIARVAACVEQVEARGVDMTANYADWQSLAFCLASLGESGRAFYHAVSRYYPEYDPAQTDAKFDDALRNGHKDISGFFAICQDHGITFK